MKRNYYAFIVIVCSLFSVTAYAQNNAEITLYDVRRVNGVHEVFSITENMALMVPEWNPEKDSAPPLMLKQVSVLAKEWFKKNYPKYQGFDIGSIKIGRIKWPGMTKRWYYLIDFSRLVGDIGTTGEYVSIAILMDGTIVRPEIIQTR